MPDDTPAEPNTLRMFLRFKDRPLASGTTLRQLLTIETIDAPTVTAALCELRPAVERQIRCEAARLPTQKDARNPALDDLPVADLS